MTSVTHQLDGYPAITMSKNDYDDLGRLQSKTLHGRASLKTTYSYNIRNWLTGLSGTSFKESLSYYTGPGTANYNGNISSMEWVTGKSPLESYSFTYDALNRLLSANYSCPGFWGQPVTPNYSERVVSYDKQGNILRLQRYGKNSNSFVSGSFSYPMVDDLTMSYVGNRLMKVSDNGLDPLGNDSFNYIDLHSDGSSDFSYDANGNLTKDLDKEISEISYNCLNLPSKVSFEDNGSPREISYLYDANGVKRSVKHVTPPGLIVSPMASLPGGGITIGGQAIHL